MQYICNHIPTDLLLNMSIDGPHICLSERNRTSGAMADKHTTAENTPLTSLSAGIPCWPTVHKSQARKEQKQTCNKQQQ